MNPVSQFLKDRAERFFFMCGKQHLLNHALQMTKQRVSYYGDSKLTDLVVITTAEDLPISTFFTELVPSSPHRRFIVWGKESKGMIEIIPIIVDSIRVF